MDRIAKILSRRGICSRRDAEKLIEAGKVKINGEIIKNPATKLSGAEKIEVNGKLVPQAEETGLYMYHKPTGLVVSNKDEQGRKTVFDDIAQKVPRLKHLISIGRLDLNSEGLLLLTNDGELARRMELPSSDIPRIYRVRIFGQLSADTAAKLAAGVTVDGIKYGAIKCETESKSKSNSWVKVELREGKNREIRKVFEHFNHPVSRLIRVSYGPYQLGKLKPSDIKEVEIFH